MTDAAATITRGDITGLVLAGGMGRRMGSSDKGLLDWNGSPLARHALERLRPQVGRLAISANRHLDAYRAFGEPVWPDADDLPAFAGPLAGFAAGLAHCATRCLATVPCDAPFFPPDLVERLAAALSATGGDVAIACTRDGGTSRPQPVFSLMRTSLGPRLAAYIAGGGRKVGHWAASQRCIQVVFDDEAAFANINTPEQLRSMALQVSAWPDAARSRPPSPD